MFSDFSKDISKTTTSIFGGLVVFERVGIFRYTDVTTAIRKDVETLDSEGQVVSRVNTVRIAHNEITVVPKRGDLIIDDCDTYTLGVRMNDDGNFYMFEATK